MVPEQMENAATVDHRADIFALGKTLLHMIVGGEPPMYADQVLNRVDEPYMAFINRCIKENPDDRFQSVTDMLETFTQIKSEFERT